MPYQAPDPWANPLPGYFVESPTPPYQGTTAASGTPPVQGGFLQRFKDKAFGAASKGGQAFNEYSDKAYQSSKANMGSNPRQAFTKQMSPKGFPGAINYGAAGLSGGLNFMSNANQGMDLDDNIAQSVGLGAGSLAGGAGGAALGTAAAPFLLAVPGAGPLLAAAAPFIGQAAGTMLGGSIGKAGLGTLNNAIDGDDGFGNRLGNRGEDNTINSREINSGLLGEYAQYLDEDQQKALGAYIAMNDAQQTIDRDNALFTDDLNRAGMREAAQIGVQNEAFLNTLNNKARMLEGERNNQYNMLQNNSSNMWSGLNTGMSSLAGLYA